MRIVAGQYKGRRLLNPKTGHIRPTSDKVRGALFNALRSRGAVEGLHVMDLFCGSGALGLEALSQGAQSCTFIDKNRESLALAQDNVGAVAGDQEHVRFVLKDVRRLPVKGDSYPLMDLVFLDPPYHQDLIGPALGVLIQRSWLADGALCVLETEKAFDFETCSLGGAGRFNIEAQYQYGDTKIFFVRASSA